jgi:hypothetical protein
MWDKDFMHPLDPGHKAIADMAIYLLQQTALQVTDRSPLPARNISLPACACHQLIGIPQEAAQQHSFPCRIGS